MAALVVTADNEMSIVEYNAPNYDVIRKAVGGWYEHVHPSWLKPPFCMMVNEEGLLHELPINLIGSILYGTYDHGQPIVGDIIFLKDGYYGGEPDVVGITEDEARELGHTFTDLTCGTVRWANN